MDADKKFEQLLDNLRREAQGGAQFLYAYLTIHTVAGEDTAVHRALNDTPLFWNTALAALQSSVFMCLGRIFDQNAPHTIDQLLRQAQDHRDIFSKSALAQRKAEGKSPPPSWVAGYVRDAYEPTPDDFRRLRAHVKTRRTIYQSTYSVLRHKIFAHREITDPQRVAEIFANTNVRELQRIFAFVYSLYEALWQLYFNGRKPSLRPVRYSLKRMRRLPSKASSNISVQEKIIIETEQLVRKLSR